MKKILPILVIVAIIIIALVFSQKNTGQNDLNVNNKDVSDVPASIDTSLPTTTSDGVGGNTQKEGTSDGTGASINL